MPLRTFSLNSPEFYEAVTAPPEPHMWGPGLPRDPPPRDPEVFRAEQVWGTGEHRKAKPSKPKPKRRR